MTVGAAQILLKTGGNVPEAPFFIAGSGPLPLLYATQLLDFGVRPEAVIDTTPPGDRPRPAASSRRAREATCARASASSGASRGRRADRARSTRSRRAARSASRPCATASPTERWRHRRVCFSCTKASCPTSTWRRRSAASTASTMQRAASCRSSTNGAAARRGLHRRRCRRHRRSARRRGSSPACSARDRRRARRHRCRRATVAPCRSAARWRATPDPAVSRCRVRAAPRGRGAGRRRALPLRAGERRPACARR